MVPGNEASESFRASIVDRKLKFGNGAKEVEAADQRLSSSLVIEMSCSNVDFATLNWSGGFGRLQYFCFWREGK